MTESAGAHPTSPPGTVPADPEPGSSGSVEVEATARFELLYREHFGAMYAYARRRVGVADVNDVVADVFTAAWRRIGDVPRPPDDRLWLYGAARRVVSQHDRGRRRGNRLLGKLAGHHTRAVENPDPTEAGSAPEMAGLDLIAPLRPRDRELVKLMMWDGLSHAEIAELLGCSVNAVAVRWHRSLARLRRNLDIPTGSAVGTTTPALGRPRTEGA